MKRRDMFRYMAGCLPLLGQTQILGQTQTAPDVLVHADVSRVLLDVAVSARHGEFVPGLTRENFRVYEDGRLQEIRGFSLGDTPVTVGILVDESFSMRPKRNQVLTAALLLVRESNPLDEMFVLHFNEKVFNGLPDSVPFSSDLRQLRQALFTGRAEGPTVLYDAVVAGLKRLETGSRAKKALVAISDGGDTHSQHSFADVEALLQESLATVYAIGIFDEEDADRNPKVLNKLVHISGGLAFFPQEPAELVPICRRIAKDIRSRYSLSYAPAENDGREGIRRIKVEAVSPEQGRLHVTTRTSYRYQPARVRTP